jgi:hypothetical protein
MKLFHECTPERIFGNLRFILLKEILNIISVILAFSLTNNMILDEIVFSLIIIE